MDNSKYSLSYHQEKSYHGISIKVLKSAVQKYLRRGNILKGVWCLIELDRFNELKGLDSKIDSKIKSIRTNMINRLIACMSEDIGIASPYLPIYFKKQYLMWLENRDNDIGKVILTNLYKTMVKQKKIRLISDCKTVFLLPPSYNKLSKSIRKGGEGKYPTLKIIHQELIKTYPQILYDINQAKDVYPTKNYIDLFNNHPNEKYQKYYCYFNKWYESAYNKSIYSFVFIKEIFEISEKEISNEIIKYIWKCLKDWFKLEYEKEQIITSLEYFYNKMNHQEKPLYLYNAIQIWIFDQKIDWDNKLVPVDDEFNVIQKLYTENSQVPIFEDFIYDIHTGSKDSLIHFAEEGAFVENEASELRIEELREIYIKMKIRLEYYDKIIEKYNNKFLNMPINFHMEEISLDELNYIKQNYAQAQKKCSSHKKCVYVLENEIWKGPYKYSDKSFWNNIKFTRAMEILELFYKLKQELCGSLPLKKIVLVNNDIYIVWINVGSYIPIQQAKLTSTKIEKNIKVLDRQMHILRVSELEKISFNENTIDKYQNIWLASLHHLYFRYLLSIGDSGSHNILVRKDIGKDNQKFIAGIDLEELRNIKLESNLSILSLFSKISKLQKTIYSDLVNNIILLSTKKITKSLLSKLDYLDINIKHFCEIIEKKFSSDLKLIIKDEKVKIIKKSKKI
jgi:hypothetical protein